MKKISDKIMQNSLRRNKQVCYVQNRNGSLRSRFGEISNSRANLNSAKNQPSKLVEPDFLIQTELALPQQKVFHENAIPLDLQAKQGVLDIEGRRPTEKR